MNTNPSSPASLHSPSPSQGVVARAPGRVNLLGEHTDYNQGFVLPTVIPQHTTVWVRPSDDRAHLFVSQDLGESVPVQPDGPCPDGFAAYPWGCMQALRTAGVTVPPLHLTIQSQIPMGSGLSSSAALEVATLRALREVLALDPNKFDDLQVALLAQEAENKYVGVQCGLMDQMASSLATSGMLLFLDTRSLDRRLLPMPQDSDLVVIHSGQPRTLAGSAYNQRRAQCRQAAKLLEVESLRDVDSPGAVEALGDGVLRRRARHVVSENLRVLEACGDGKMVDPHVFGALMNLSHASLRDDFEVSTDQLDLLVSLLGAHHHVLGARLTGAGFGGACVALVHKGTADVVAKEVLAAYGSHGFHGQQLVP